MTWPGLSTAPASCGTGTAVLADGRQIVHFHSAHQADLCLGRPAVERLGEELGQSTAVRLVAGSDWVTVLLDGDSDADLVVTLASVARQANARRPGGTGDGACNQGHISIIKLEQAA